MSHTKTFDGRLMGWFAVLFAVTVVWSAYLTGMVVESLWLTSELARYLISKGVLCLFIAVVLWRLGLFARVGFKSGPGYKSYLTGLPLLVLGVLAFLAPDRGEMTLSFVTGWAVVVLLVGFSEEVIFRGVLWQALAGSSLWRRAVVTSVMFGLVHMIGALGPYEWTVAAAQATFAVGCGMILAAMREQAGTIWSVIVVHAVFDMAAISGAGSVGNLLEPGLETYLRFLVPAAVFTVWGGVALWLIERRKGERLGGQTAATVS